MIEHIRTLSLEKPWEVTVGRATRQRTTNQNSLMWMWHHEVALFTGHDIDDIHEIIKVKFLRPQIKEFNGEQIEVRSTRKMTTADMSEFMNAYYAFVVSDLGLMLPVPEDRGR